jgi:hypothetical protein
MFLNKLKSVPQYDDCKRKIQNSESGSPRSVLEELYKVGWEIPRVLNVSRTLERLG